MINIPLRAESIAEYLAENPTFFHMFPNLLNTLRVPHPKSGKIVSLLERQIFQLREQRDAFQIEVDTLKDIAGENGQLFIKVQDFTKSLMATKTDQQAVDCIYEMLTELFGVEHIMMVSWDAPSTCLQGVSQLGVSQTWAKTLKTSLSTNQPVCGLLEDAWQKGLFHTQKPMGSVCVLPLGVDSIWGVLALGSQSERFHPDQGSYFLKMMSGIVTAKLDHLFIS